MSRFAPAGKPRGEVKRIGRWDEPVCVAKLAGIDRLASDLNSGRRGAVPSARLFDAGAAIRRSAEYYDDTRDRMRTDVLAAAFAVVAVVTLPGVARADGPTCSVTATDKKLGGAAKKSFMKKCASDAQASCDAAAADKKLAGAAKTSFTKKCVQDSVGS